jgi:uncharacterized protein (TIGR02118 family)
MPAVMFGLYRWHGVSRADFRRHYVERHVEIGKRLPHVRRYSIFIVEAEGDEAAPGPPRPDAFALMEFDTRSDFEAALASKEFREAQADNEGFIGHYDTYPVERLDLI